MKKSIKTLLIVLGSVAGVCALALGVLFFIRSRSATVNVYPVRDTMLINSDAGGSQTQGPVKADRMQTVFVTKTQVVTDICVKEGDRVSVGDELMHFDTTLSDVELQRQEIKVQQLELEIAQAEENIRKVNTYRVGSPIYDPPQKSYTPHDSYLYLYSRAGRGVQDDPYVFIWSEDRQITPEFVSNNVGWQIYPIIDPAEEGEEAPAPEPQPSDVIYVVFEIRTGNSMEGHVNDSYMVEFIRVGDGFACRLMPVPVTYDPLNPKDDTPVDNNVYVSTWAELNQMKQEAQEKLTSLQHDYKSAQYQLSLLQYEVSNGTVLSKVDGIVKTLADPEAVAGTEDPVMVVSGGGGWFITGYLSETELPYMSPGDTVSVMSWETGSSCEGTITEISAYPSTDANAYHYSQGNSNSTLYPFTVAVGEDVVLREGENVNLTYTPSSRSPDTIYLLDMFIRRENGQAYVLLEGAGGKLERRNVSTGGSLWGSYTAILSGVSKDDFVAFPYGKGVEPGANTQERDIDSLYSYG